MISHIVVTLTHSVSLSFSPFLSLSGACLLSRFLSFELQSSLSHSLPLSLTISLSLSLSHSYCVVLYVALSFTFRSFCSSPSTHMDHLHFITIQSIFCMNHGSPYSKTNTTTSGPKPDQKRIIDVIEDNNVLQTCCSL